MTIQLIYSYFCLAHQTIPPPQLTLCHLIIFSGIITTLFMCLLLAYFHLPHCLFQLKMTACDPGPC